MPALSGTVEKVFSKEKDAPDQWGNTFRHAMRIAGFDGWIGLGDGKKAEVTVKDGKGFRALTEGSEVEFLYTERAGNNGTFYDAKKTGIKVLKWGEGNNSHSRVPVGASGTAPKANGADGATTPAQSAPRPPTARTGASSGGTDWARKDAGAAASASIDKAIRYLTVVEALGSNEEENFSLILDVARSMNKLTTTLLEEILSPVKAEAPVVQVAAPAPKAAPKKPAPVPAKQATWEEEEPDALPF